MILHTILPREAVFPPCPPRQPKEISLAIPGGYLTGIREEGGVRIVRVFSTDPKCYLDPALSPGQLYHPT